MLMKAIFCLTLLSVMLMIINYVICVKPKTSREKTSIFECGFDPKGFSRLPFSMHFFLIALIFLIFDVEITLLIPIPCMWNLMAPQTLIWSMILVIIILLAGTLIEWIEGSLEWNS